jgi:hypothetical protein
MTTVTIETHYLHCPNCRAVLHKGRRPRGFGPGYVRCKGCSIVFDSTLDEWAGLSLREKLSAAAKEFVLPSSLEKMSPNTVYLLIIFSPLLVLALPFLVPASLVRLLKMVRESNRFTRTRIPPVW